MIHRFPALCASAALLVLALAAVPVVSGDGAGANEVTAAAAGATLGAATDADASHLAAAGETISTCAECHDLSGPGYTRNPHLALNRDAALAAHYGVQNSCAGCHGDGTEHSETGEVDSIFGFGLDQPATVKSEQCLTCHADAHPRFFATAHAQAGLACTDCHTIHADGSRGLLTPPKDAIGAELAREIGRSSAACIDCHQQTQTQFAFNERHRLEEGILACVDCHSPHEPQARIRLGGFKQDTCVECHADKGGPFVFEHGAQRIEGCVACHTPHGSPNRHMLKFQSVADSCYSCHAAVPGFHTRFTSETICTNCHVSIHGSNFDAGFLR